MKGTDRMPDTTQPRGPSLPIVGQTSIPLEGGCRNRVARVSGRALSEKPSINPTDQFGPDVSTGLGYGPSLLIEDHHQVRLFEDSGNKIYSYRALLLAGEGDVVVVDGKRNPAFEQYCRDVLRLGRVTIRSATYSPPGDSLAGRCLYDEDLLNWVAGVALESGGLNIIPYMGTAGIWALARRVADRTGLRISVAASSPDLTRRCNNKLWFTQMATEILGGHAVPDTTGAYSLTELSKRIRELSAHQPSVAVKLADSAGSAGNIVIDSRFIRGRPLREIRTVLNQLLLRVGWRDSFPLLASVWEAPILASPSIHVWVPGRGDGDPIIEGIFEQQFADPSCEFSGAVPSRLARTWMDRIAAQAASLALFFQAIGYFGRCSFDAIIVGETRLDGVLHWIECNGRWGGVSIPMTLVNRLTGNWRDHPFVVLENSHRHGSGIEFGRVLHALKDDLYRPNVHPQGVVLLSPNPIEVGTGYQLLALGKTVADARERATRVAMKLESLMGANESRAGLGRLSDFPPENR